MSNQYRHLAPCYPNVCSKEILIDIRINTFFCCGDKFIPFDEMEGPLDDTAYIEGCIVLDIGGVSLLNARYSDLVDQLWSYLMNGLSSVKHGKDFECYFPDTPVKITMKCLRNDWIEFSVDETKVEVQLKMLTDAMTKEAHQFFQKLKVLDKQSSEFWQSSCDFIQTYL